jgi:uncharacterized membrane protein (UPF0136 family)
MSVKGGWRQATALAVKRGLIAGTVAGLVLTAAGWGVLWRVRFLDNLGIILLVVCPGILLAWALRRVKNRRPVRDELLAQRVARCEATADAAKAEAAEARAAMMECKRRVDAFGEIVARCALRAEVMNPDTEATQPGLRAVDGRAWRDIARLPA